MRRLPYFWCTNILAKDISKEEVVYFVLAVLKFYGTPFAFESFHEVFFSRHPKAVSQADPIWMYDWRILEDHDTG